MLIMPKPMEIKRRREIQGYSQHQLSLKAELSGCAICRIESGKTTRIHTLRAKAIANVLKCNIEDIFFVNK